MRITPDIIAQKGGIWRTFKAVLKRSLSFTWWIVRSVWRHLPQRNETEEDVPSVYARFWKCFDASRSEANCLTDLASMRLPGSREVDRRLLGLEDLRVIDLCQLNNEDESYIKNRGYSIFHLKRNFDTHSAEERERPFPYILPKCMADEERRGIMRQASMTAFQLKVLRDGGLTGYDPQTGQSVVSHCSILLDEAVGPPFELPVIFYRFATDRVFYVACHGTLGLRTLVFLPESKLVIIGEAVYSDAAIEVGIVEAFRRFILRNRISVLPYVEESQEATFNPQIAVVFKSPLNYAHQLLNDLSAIQHLIDCDETKNIDVVLAGGFHFFGHLSEIFPEIASGNVIEVASLSEITQHILKMNLFAIKLGYNFIQERLIQRIKAVCMRKVSSKLIARTREIRTLYWPIVWVTIRVVNRTIEHQGEVLSDVIRRLAEPFPRLGVILDGFCLPVNVTKKYMNDFAEVIKKEQTVCREIKMAVPKSVVLYNLIGKPMSECIVMSQVADVYLAHYGTLQHKIAWFSEKPGIEHGNTYIANILHTLAISCENVMAPTILPPQCVEDVPESGMGRGESGNNYRVEPKELVARVLEALRGRAGTLT